MIKPCTYFDAGPELTIEEHCSIGTPILQDTTNRQTGRHKDTLGKTFTYTNI